MQEQKEKCTHLEYGLVYVQISDWRNMNISCKLIMRSISLRLNVSQKEYEITRKNYLPDMTVSPFTIANAGPKQNKLSDA
jgi:hypothetical protein